MFDQVVEAEKNSGLRGVLNRHFGAIDSPEEAQESIRTIGKLFYWLAALQATLGVFLAGPAALFDAAAYALLALWLRRRRSRVAACLLLLVAGLEAADTIMNLLHVGERTGGSNIFLAVIVVGAAIRAVQATFRYNGKWPATPTASPTSVQPT
jgi:hypothetical protein